VVHRIPITITLTPVGEVAHAAIEDKKAKEITPEQLKAELEICTSKSKESPTQK